ncbi:MAG: hypothetical protein HKP61_07785 [Dactylosporangium sp.]|nr:hypothetical protein [Dactylosporangium sp.]NNJ60837.1 hypothetical protein [Dactylosporangium sp.]
MLSERRAQRLAHRAARADAGGAFGFWARRAWRKLTTSAGNGDPVALGLLCRLVAEPAAPRRRDARSAVASLWCGSRDLGLREIVRRTGAIAEGPARLVTAALHNRLTEYWSVSDVRVTPTLLADPDPDVRAGTLAAVRAADPGMLSALWEVVEALTRQRSQPGTDPWWSGPLPMVLLAATSPAPARSLDALWRTWLATPHETLWRSLSRWQMPGSTADVRALSLVAIEPDARRLAAPDMRATLLDAASRRGDHPIAALAQQKIIDADDQDLVDAVCETAMTRPELVSFCRTNRLAPADPVRRSVYFALTGQPDQLQAFDPDGSLLALAYASADQATRTRLRKAMLSGGGLDLVRVLVGEDRRGRIQTMTEAEIRYLAEQLAARGAWADLWQILLDLPVVRAAHLMALFSDGWQPGDGDSRELFARLVAVDASVLERGVNDLLGIWPPAVRQARVTFQGRVNDVSFAPDTPHLVVAGTARVAGVVDLTRGRLVERYDGFAASVGRVLHLGGGTFLAGERTNSTTNPCRILRCADRKLATVAQVSGPVTALAPAGAGRFVAGTRAGDLLLGAVGDAAPTRVPVSRLGLDHDQDWPRAVAADPGGERLAVLGRSLTLTDSTASRVLARGYQQTVVARAVLLEPDLLATSDQRGNVNLLRRVHNDLRPTARTSVPGLGGLAPVGPRRQIVIASREGDLHFHNQTTFAATGTVPGLGDGQATSVHVAPRGDFLAVGFAAGFTDLYDLRIGDVPALATRPLAAMVPAHLGILTAARRARVVTGPSAEILDLLQTCLEHRFRFDIEISDTVTLATGEYDIALT